MVRTSFLPSDDSPRLPYHIPGNAFAVVELRGAAAMLRKLATKRAAVESSPTAKQPVITATDGTTPDALAIKADELASEINRAIAKWGVVYHPQTGTKAYAMEVDGYGNSFFGDDANPPSLLSLPFIGFLNATDPTYLATRKLLLSNETNPYFYGSADLEAGGLGGIGSEDASGNAGLGHVYVCVVLVWCVSCFPAFNWSWMKHGQG
jgi:meiotically up-regulated gene 157 (Mug157) protein